MPGGDLLNSANDKQRLAAFIRRSIRQGFCAPYFANFSDIIDHADDDLFKQILSNPNYIEKLHTVYLLLYKPML